MEAKSAIKTCAALSGDLRMNVMLLLSEVGRDGLPSGDIARRLDVPANTLSTQLGLLENAGLVEKRREGRNVIYNASLPTLKKLIQFLAFDCAAGRIKGVNVSA